MWSGEHELENFASPSQTNPEESERNNMALEIKPACDILKVHPKKLASFYDPVWDGPAKADVRVGSLPALAGPGSFSTNKMSSVAFVTMTQNGVKRLPALFESVLGFADKAVILDTGSTDGTIAWLQEQRFLPVQFIQLPFINFERTRNDLMRFAQGLADWLLLLDDDMTLKFTTPLSGRLLPGDRSPQQQMLGSLTGDAYLIEHLDIIRYWVTRLVRGDKLWQYKGVTHEYLEGGGNWLPRLEGVGIVHKFDHRQPEKFTRDLQLLTADLARDPDDIRTVFYLANTLRDMGKTTAAIRFYCMRANMGGWDEEVFISMFEAARLAEDSDAMEKVFLFRPTRAEPAAWLTEYFKKDGNRSGEEHWEEVRAAIPFPEKDVLFVNTAAYGPKKL
jgi:glycosyltransferase involved in cell wall biosynthesis